MTRTPRSTRSWHEARVGRLIQRVVGVMLILTVLLVLVRPHDPNIAYDRVWVFVGLLAAVAAAAVTTAVARSAAVRRLRGRAERWPPILVWGIAAAGSVIGGVAGVLLALPLRYSYGWDAAVVTRFSRELSAHEGLSAYAFDYLSRYPNNVPLVALMNTARDLGGSSDAGMYDTYIRFNGVSLALVLLFTFVLVRLLRGTAVAFLAQVVVFLLVGCSPWMAVPYTDVPAMPFVLGAVTLAAVSVARRRRARTQALLVVLAFVLVAVAFVVKSTPASIAVAFGLVALVMMLGRPARSRVRATALLASGAVAFALTWAGSTAVAYDVAHVSPHQLDTSRTPPLTWWLANGLTTTPSISGRPYFGVYSPEMVKESMHLSGQTLHSWSDHRLQDQLATMGPLGIASFEVRKLAFNWGDGMFFAWGAYDFQAWRLHEHDRAAQLIQSWQHPAGAHYPVRSSLTNGLWLALLLWAGAGLARARYRPELLVVVVTVLGIAAFTLVFQGCSRYLFAYVPVVVAMAASVSPGLRPPPESETDVVDAPMAR